MLYPGERGGPALRPTRFRCATAGWIVLSLVLLGSIGCRHDRDNRSSTDTATPTPPVSEAQRVANWREDLQVLASELPKRHANAFFHVNEAAWRRDVDALDRQMPQLD